LDPEKRLRCPTEKGGESLVILSTQWSLTSRGETEVRSHEEGEGGHTVESYQEKGKSGGGSQPDALQNSVLKGGQFCPSHGWKGEREGGERTWNDEEKRGKTRRPLLYLLEKGTQDKN